MKPGLRIGDRQEIFIPVREEMQARFDDGPVHPLYGTASLINHMEWAARQHILPYLESNEEGVGYHVDIRHLKPTPIGATVRVLSTVTGLTENRVISRVEAWNAHDKIGEGTLIQALVSKETLYSEIKTPQATGIQTIAFDPDSTVEAPWAEEVEAPPPAELLSADGNTRFSLELLKWETGLFPCTRYDEWLVCRLTLQQGSETQQTEGPFLLHFEVEEWLYTLQGLLDNTLTYFESDFLEPVLKVRFNKDKDASQYQVHIALSPMSSSEQEASAPMQADFSCTDQHFRIFIAQLDTQLEGFLSKL
jgi:fluoroacetyl-CoA thioesterase